MRHSASRHTDEVLKRELIQTAAQDRTTTASLIDLIAEFDWRRLYVPEGYASMYAYCIGFLHMSEAAAFKRIRAGRAALRFPALLVALEGGRLHLSAIVLLAPNLKTATEETADELIAAATHKSKVEVERLLAGRFPQSDAPTRIRALSSAAPEPCSSANATSPAGLVRGSLLGGSTFQLAPGPVEKCESSAPDVRPGGVPDAADSRPRVEPAAPPAKVAAPPCRYALQVTIDQETHDLLRSAQELLGHSLPSGDVGEVLKRALRLLEWDLRRRKFAATSRPRQSPQRPSVNPRHIPAAVRRAVSARDRGQCTFVSEAGHRCGQRKFLEYDHVHAVARGGESTVAGLRLRCRAHNQHEAERTFGTGFMEHKRQRGRLAADARRGSDAS